MSEDTGFIDEFLKGKEEGFEMLVRKYQDRVLNIVYSIIGRDRESEDITQEVFLKVYHNLRSFRRHSQFSTWLYRIVVNTTYSFVRRRNNVVGDESTLANKESPGRDPAGELLTKERESILQRAMGKVPVKFMAAMVLKDIEGLSYRDIAGILHCSIGTVESRIYRARQFLKEEVSRIEGGAV